MGSWDVTCAVSGTFIQEGDNCLVIPLVKKEYHSYGTSYHRSVEVYSPCGFVIKGEYDSYGGIQDVEDDDNHKFNQLFFQNENYTRLLNDMDLITPKGDKVYCMFINPDVFNLLTKSTYKIEKEFLRDIDRGNSDLTKSYEDYWMYQDIIAIKNDKEVNSEFKKLMRKPHFFSFDRSSATDGLNQLCKYEFLDEEYSLFLEELATNYVMNKQQDELLKLVKPIHELSILSFGLKFIASRPFMQCIASTQGPEKEMLVEQNKFLNLLIKKNKTLIKEQNEYE